MSTKKDVIAFDFSSVRSKDQDGRLKVELTNISKANVCPYYGYEIPDAEALGLDPNRIYKLYRDPEELRLAAETSNGIQLMQEHIAVSPDEPMQMQVVGSTGTDAVFEDPYLKNSLVVWVKDAIDLIESGKKKQLSCAYYYRADMTPGTFEGAAYDGVMRDIRFNHVALVVEGRAGSDVLVSDSKLPDLTIKDLPMTKKIIASDVAKDEDKDEDEKVMKKAEDDNDMEDMSEDEDADEQEDKDKAKDKSAKDKSAKDKSAKDEDKDEEDDEDEKSEKKSKKAEDRSIRKPITKAAMDAALAVQAREIESRMRANAKSLREAEDMVRPYVGNLLAMDSAEDVYATYLKSEGVDVSDVPTEAYKALASQVIKYSAKSKAPKSIAMDHSAAKSFAEEFPNVARIRSI
jgi:hypothetical protein